MFQKKKYLKNMVITLKYDHRIYLIPILLLLEIDENKIFVFFLWYRCFTFR